MVLQAGGKVVLGGTNLRTAAGGNTRYALLRFNTDGTLDATFTLFPTTTSSGTALVPGYFGPRFIRELPGGSILTSGQRVIRFLPDGTLDSTFTPLDYTSPYFTNGVDGFLESYRFDVNPNTGVAYLANPGPLYARLGGMPVPGEITKLNLDGTIDSQFHSPVVELEDFGPDVQIAASGAVYVSGFHTAFGNTGNATITRLFADGTRDATYSLDTLPFADKQAAGFALLPDSSAYVVYFSGSLNGAYGFSNLARLLPTGALDTSFHLSSALQTSLNINAFDGNDTSKLSFNLQISAAPSGRAYVFSSGAQATVNANGNLKPIRINTDGTEDTSVPALGFPVGEVMRDSSGITGGSRGYLQRLAQTADGGFIVLASVAPFPSTTLADYNYQVIKLRADGSLDPNFGSPSLTSTAGNLFFADYSLLFDPMTGITSQPPNGFYGASAFPVSSAATLPDGSVLLAGNFRLTGGSVTYSLAKLTATGALDTSFSPPVLENRARPTRPALITNARVAPDGKVWVLGRFDTIGGNPTPGVARLNPDGTLDSTFGLTGVGYYDSFGFADVVFANRTTAYLVGTFRRPGEPLPFALTRIVGPPVIISPLTATGTVGVPFTYQFVAQGATSLGASNLPAGLTFDIPPPPFLHAIVGSPSAAGVFQVGLSATNGAGTTMASLVITVQPAPSSGPVIISGTAATGRPGQPFSFHVITTGGTPAARVSASGLPAGLSIDAVTGLISGTPTAEGSSAVTLTVTDGAFTASSILQLTFTADPALPVIIGPSSASLTPGQAFNYTINAPGSPDPSDPTMFTLIGTLPPGLSFNATTGVISGTYTGPLGPEIAGGIVLGSIQLFATNSHGTSTFNLALRAAPSGAVNIATRLPVGTGANVLIGGFIVQGTAAKVVLVRAIGPSLTNFGVPNALQDPTLELHDGAHPDRVVLNDNWKDTQEQIIRDTGIAPADDRESAIVIALDPGSYTAIVAGKNGTTGIGLVEVYDLGTAPLGTSGTAKLANIATRGFVDTGNNVMIGGFIVVTQPTRVIIRAIGPSLTQFGVPDALANPQLELHDATSLIAQNDDWQTTQIGGIITSDQVAEIQNSQLAPTNPAESAIIVTLQPGSYTAIVRGVNNTTGNGLVEVYALQ
jgi:uncharacterized delta-60 repeat protein